MTQLLSHGWIALFLFASIALSVGSFLNVAIYRLPVMMRREWRSQASEILELANPVDAGPPFNLMVPRSRCPGCETPIAARHNIPVLSWLLLRGRCASCNAPISVRYPLVELLTAIASILVVEVYGYTWLGLAGL